MSEQGFPLAEPDLTREECQKTRRRVVPVPFGSGDRLPVLLDAGCPVTPHQVALIGEHEAARRTLVADPRPALAQAQARRFARGGLMADQPTRVMPRSWQDAEVIVRTDGTREGTTVVLADGSPLPFMVSGVEWRVSAGGRPEVAVIVTRARLAVGP